MQRPFWCWETWDSTSMTSCNNPQTWLKNFWFHSIRTKYFLNPRRNKYQYWVNLKYIGHIVTEILRNRLLKKSIHRMFAHQRCSLAPIGLGAIWRLAGTTDIAKTLSLNVKPGECWPVVSLLNFACSEKKKMFTSPSQLCNYHLLSFQDSGIHSGTAFFSPFHFPSAPFECDSLWVVPFLPKGVTVAAITSSDSIFPQIFQVSTRIFLVQCPPLFSINTWRGLLWICETM